MDMLLVIEIATLLLLLSNDSALASKIDKSRTGRTAAGVASELADLAVFGSRRAVIVRNTANDWLRIWCSSKDDTTGEKRLNPGDSLSFSFKPMVIGGATVFWCTVDYKTFWARWDVFGNKAPYGKEDDNNKAYIYEIRHDGVYYKDRKFRGLAAGHHRYTLWESYDQHKNPFGMSLRGFVDRGMCNNVPNFMEGKISAATLCDNSCIILYSNLHCGGQTSRIQAPSRGCLNFWFSFFNDRTKSLKGC